MTGIHVDAHVHLHPGMDLRRMASAVLSRAEGLPGPLVLLLAEGLNERALARVRAELSPQETDEAGTVRVGPGAEVTIVYGRQLITADGLEVLALGLRPDHPVGEVPDRSISTTELLKRVLDTDAVAVLPWGVGKWLGRRGTVVEEIVTTAALAGHPRFALGDIFHRTWPWPEPRPFHSAVPVLRGTDPLAIPGLEGRPGTFGTVLEGSLDPARPFASVRSAVEARRLRGGFGRHASPLTALAEQIRYRRRPAEAGTP
jgi:hypothetical protein